MKSQRRPMFATAVAVIATPLAVHAATLYGGPTYNTSTRTGYQRPRLPFDPGSTVGNGTAVGCIQKYSGGIFLGYRAVRWDASGTAATELDNLGDQSDGYAPSQAYAINSAGTAVGSATKYIGGTHLGSRAVRWDASGTAATELGNLGTDGTGATGGEAFAINSAGTAVGTAAKYLGGTHLGSRAVRWDASGTAATELGNLGTDTGGLTTSSAFAVNGTGTAVGYASKWNGSTTLGTRAVRWDASGTTAIELDNLGVDSDGHTNSRAFAINTAGTTIGVAEKYSGGTFLGFRAVRWAASGTAGSELGNLGTDGNGATEVQAYSINSAGIAVGYAEKYSGNTYLGTRAVRWDSSGAGATELGNLGTDGAGYTISHAYVVNSSGIAVGHAATYSGSTFTGTHAVIWDVDGAATDLNTLLPPEDTAFWTLNYAVGISDTSWVTGYGTFDPDGGGPLAAYQRAFLIQVPEPATLSALALGGLTLLRRRRRG